MSDMQAENYGDHNEHAGIDLVYIQCCLYFGTSGTALSDLRQALARPPGCSLHRANLRKARPRPINTSHVPPEETGL